VSAPPRNSWGRVFDRAVYRARTTPLACVSWQLRYSPGRRRRRCHRAMRPQPVTTHPTRGRDPLPGAACDGAVLCQGKDRVSRRPRHLDRHCAGLSTLPDTLLEPDTERHLQCVAQVKTGLWKEVPEMGAQINAEFLAHQQDAEGELEATPDEIRAVAVDTSDSTPSGAAKPRGEPAATRAAHRSSLRALLASYDLEVEASLREALESSTGIGRVRVLHNCVRQSVAVHDAVLRSALCPLLEDLPGGRAVSDQLRRGCEERAELLARFDAVSRHVAAHNVYPVSGDEIDQILEGLSRSFNEHAHDETIEVGNLLQAAEASVDPLVIAARMAFEARHAPTRVHSAVLRHPRSNGLKFLYRTLDRLDDWSDTHHNWLDPDHAVHSPRAELVNVLKAQAGSSQPSIRGVLEGFDNAVEAIVAELDVARSAAEQAVAAHRLSAAVAIHDSVVNGVLCPLLEAVWGGEPLAVRLRQGCQSRAQLQQSWKVLTRGVAIDDIYRLQRREAEDVIGKLAEAFRVHGRECTVEVASFLGHLPDEFYRTRTSPLDDIMWPWHSEGPALLALRMALWAESAPTRSHPVMLRRPSSRALRTFCHFTDHFSDYWGDAWIERWLLPRRSPRPFSQVELRKDD